MPLMSDIERIAYLAHSKSKSFSKRLDSARKIILNNKDCCVSVSWGKDSVVMMHLAYTLLNNVNAVHGHYKTDAENFEDLHDVRDKCLRLMQAVNYKEVLVTGNWEMYKRVGHFFIDAESKIEKDAFYWYKKRWSEEMSEATGSKVMIGIRPEESNVRRMLVARLGAEYVTREGRCTALPLVGWSGQDIWAYLVSRGLPWLKIYDGNQDRNRARSDFTFGEKSASSSLMRHGLWLDWRDVYPVHFKLWTDRWPEMKQLCGYL